MPDARARESAALNFVLEIYMELVSCGKLSRAQLDALFDIVSNAETMRMVGLGKPWTRKRLDEIIEWCDGGDPRFYDGAIVENGRVLGLVGVHAIPKHLVDKLGNGVQLYIVVAPAERGRGVAAWALRAVTAIMRSRGIGPIWILVQAANARALRAFERIGEQARVGGEEFIEFVGKKFVAFIPR